MSPGEVEPAQNFRSILENGTYSLPLYPTSLLLATDIELTVDVPFIFHTLPTLIKLSYDPHITGAFGPFSFGPLHKASVGNMKFRVGIRENKILITLPGTQLIGYVSDVVPQHPRETHSLLSRAARSVSSQFNVHATESEFDQWLFSKKSKEIKIEEDGSLHKDTKSHADKQSVPNSPSLENVNSIQDTLSLETLSMLITPTVPLSTKTVSV